MRKVHINPYQNLGQTVPKLKWCSVVDGDDDDQVVGPLVVCIGLLMLAIGILLFAVNSSRRSTIIITIITFIIITIIRAREYIWLVEAEWPDARERERMANYRTPSQVLIRIINMTTMTMVVMVMMVVMIKMMVLVMMAMIRP